MRLLGIFGLVAAALLGLSSTLTADEGMWLYNQFPKQAFKAKYGFEPSAEWLKHVRLSSVRFNSGGGGGVVLSDGLGGGEDLKGGGRFLRMSKEDPVFL